MNNHQSCFNPLKKVPHMKKAPLLSLLIFILSLGSCFLLSGCKPGVIEEIAEGITEGVIDQIEEYHEQKRKN